MRLFFLRFLPNQQQIGGRYCRYRHNRCGGHSWNNVATAAAVAVNLHSNRCFYNTTNKAPASPLSLLWNNTNPAGVVTATLRTMSTATSSKDLHGHHSSQSSQSPSLLYTKIPRENKGPYSEYSVIHTDRSLNLMSTPFKTVVRDLNTILCDTYNAHACAIIPGSGTFGMESVVRQFVLPGSHVMVLRHGWFSYRWTEIIDMMVGKCTTVELDKQQEDTTTTTTTKDITHTVCKAVPVPVVVDSVQNKASTSTTTNNSASLTHYMPMPIDDVIAKIRQERPSVLFCPHVETSTGMMVPDAYIAQLASAMHDVNGILVLDCIASGTVWVDMQATGVDVLISAPQKGWTGSPCCALVLLSERAVNVMNAQSPNTETSFSLSLRRWYTIMETYKAGNFAYHTTMPTDALRDFHEVTVESMEIGLSTLKQRQVEMGSRAHTLFQSKGLLPVAAPPHNTAPGVLVYYSPSQTIENPIMMQTFFQYGIQIAMGVPWKINEPVGLKTFRIGLFGLDKLNHMDRTLSTLETALDHVLDQLASAGDGASRVSQQ